RGPPPVCVPARRSVGLSPFIPEESKIVVGAFSAELQRAGPNLRKATMKRIVRRSLLTLVAAGALTVPVAAVMTTGNAFAAGKSDTVGNCISDIVYGNEPNMANGAPGGRSEQAPGTKGGNVVATQSPGPWVNNPSDPRTRSAADPLVSSTRTVSISLRS